MQMPSVAARNANTLNMDGKALMMDHRYAEAAEKFREAYVLDPHPKYLVNLAISNIQQGKCGEAEKALDKVLAGRASDDLKEKARSLKGKCGNY
jgi:Flp pilus assembly protein TadD